MKLFPTVPLWSQVDFITEKSPARDFRVSLEDIESGSGHLVSGDLANYDAAGIPFEKNDILFGKLRPYLAKFYQAKSAGTAGGDIHVYRPLDHVDPRFLFYVISSKAFVSYASVSTTGVKMPRTDWPTLRNFRSPSPSFEIQRAIADYLDRETSEIDAMLDKLEGLAQLLEERRQTEIDKYINLESEYPISRLGLHADLLTGVTYTPNDVVENGGVVILRSGNIQRSKIVRNDLIRVSMHIPPKLRFQHGDILICARNGSAQLVGKSALISENEIGESWGAFMTVIRSKISNYLFWYFDSSLFNQNRGEFASSTINQLTIGTLSALRIPLPNLTKQAHIAAHLNKTTAQIDAMLAKVQELKDLLDERRSALITAAVTGQIEVN